MNNEPSGRYGQTSDLLANRNSDYYSQEATKMPSCKHQRGNREGQIIGSISYSQSDSSTVMVHSRVEIATSFVSRFNMLREVSSRIAGLNLSR
jgi:hypothetical protein